MQQKHISIHIMTEKKQTDYQHMSKHFWVMNTSDLRIYFNTEKQGCSRYLINSGKLTWMHKQLPLYLYIRRHFVHDLRNAKTMWYTSSLSDVFARCLLLHMLVMQTAPINTQLNCSYQNTLATRLGNYKVIPLVGTHPWQRKKSSTVLHFYNRWKQKKTACVFSGRHKSNSPWHMLRCQRRRLQSG